MLNFHLTHNFHILSHLGMSGSWRISRQKIMEKHTHILFHATDIENKKIFLAYIDPRRFGNMYFLKKVDALVHINKLGVDIASRSFTAKYIYEILSKFPNKVLKPFLLDQKYFAGCGNYIASEVCARAGILPNRLCQDITKLDCRNILKATKSVLKCSLKNNGLTFSGGYLDAFGEKGKGVENLVVFNQKKCGMCNGDVTKVELGKRGTYFCMKCQK